MRQTQVFRIDPSRINLDIYRNQLFSIFKRFVLTLNKFLIPNKTSAQTHIEDFSLTSCAGQMLFHLSSTAIMDWIIEKGIFKKA